MSKKEKTLSDNDPSVTETREESTPGSAVEDSASQVEGAETAAGTESPDDLIGALEAEKAELYDRLLRQRAEFENARKRLSREADEQRRFAEGQLIESLLPVLDAFDRAEQAARDAGQEDFLQGLELIYKQLRDTLVAAGLEPFESVGQTFDPNLHHAIERVETTEHPDQEVLEELQPGYRFKDRLLRPALVKVAVHIEPVEN